MSQPRPVRADSCRLRRLGSSAKVDTVPHRVGDTVDCVLARHPIFDGHNDLAWALRSQEFERDPNLEISVGRPELQTDLARLRRGRVGAQFWSVFVPGTLEPDVATQAVLEQIDLVRRLCARHPEHLQLARSADDVSRAIGAGRVASLLGAEGGRCIAGSLAVLRMLAELGVRYLTLTHNESLDWADSATDAPRAGGLSPFGAEVVAEMNNLGVIVDLSHVSVQTMHAALDQTRVPVIFSHSSCASLTSNPRNAPDDVLVRLATNGGVCMVAFVPQFVSQPVADWWRERDELEVCVDEAELARWVATNPCPPATVLDVADHVDRARDVAGIDHIGLGSDFDGCDVMPLGLEDVACFPVLLRELAARGWSTDELAKLTSKNMLRVLAETYRETSTG
jgi:membrane dipeptidase